MGVQLINGSGPQYPLVVNPDGSINTNSSISGITFSGTLQVDDVNGTMFIVSGNAWSGIGSVQVTNPAGSTVYQGTNPWIIFGSTNINNASSVGSLSVQTINGSNVLLETIPTDSSHTNPRMLLVYSGTAIGSVYQFIGTGSYVKVLSYSGAVLTGITAWTAA